MKTYIIINIICAISILCVVLGTFKKCDSKLKAFEIIAVILAILSSIFVIVKGVIL